MSRHRQRLLIFCLSGLCCLRGLANDTSRHGVAETALDRYVAQPDPSFHWELVKQEHRRGVVLSTLALTSQTWLSPKEVSRPVWTHQMMVIRPDRLTSSTALFVISSGLNDPHEEVYAAPDFIKTAKESQCVVAVLRMVPNQPLVFLGDGVPRVEDDLIAYTWDHYLRTGDERWLARLPMTKAAVRGMDAVTQFVGSPAGGAATVDRFVVSGQSKRGWTAWTTAAVDRRVVAICPMVIGVLNAEASMAHHFEAYGFYAPAMHDYVNHHIVDWFGTPEIKALFSIEDPYSYRDRLTMPKLLVNSAGDQFFVPDSTRFFFGDLVGPKYLRYVPNSDHTLRGSDSDETLEAFQYLMVRGAPVPSFKWRHNPDGLSVVSETRPSKVVLWHAVNPKARDFRLETLGRAWSASVVEEKGGVYSVKVPPPASGWEAYFMELTFDVGSKVPLKLTTDVTIVPDTLPFAPQVTAHPKGFLSR